MRTTKKTDRFRLAKQQQDCDMKLPNSTRPLCGVGEHNTKSLLFLFLNSDGVLSDFANIWQIIRNWIRSTKFEIMRIYFLSEFSVCCRAKILLPCMATWRNDVSSLFRKNIRAFFPQGQRKLLVIMRSPYWAGIVKRGLTISKKQP